MSHGTAKPGSNGRMKIQEERNNGERSGTAGMRRAEWRMVSALVVVIVRRHSSRHLSGPMQIARQLGKVGAQGF